MLWQPSRLQSQHQRGDLAAPSSPARRASGRCPSSGRTRSAGCTGRRRSSPSHSSRAGSPPRRSGGRRWRRWRCGRCCTPRSLLQTVDAAVAGAGPAVGELEMGGRHLRRHLLGGQPTVAGLEVLDDEARVSGERGRQPGPTSRSSRPSSSTRAMRPQSPTITAGRARAHCGLVVREGGRWLLRHGPRRYCGFGNVGRGTGLYGTNVIRFCGPGRTVPTDST